MERRSAQVQPPPSDRKRPDAATDTVFRAVQVPIVSAPTGADDEYETIAF